MKNLALPIALAAVMATLTACGGGGGDTTQAQTDLTTKYVGTWKSGCYATGIVKDATTAGNANVMDTVTLTRVDGLKMTATFVKTVFASTDTSCAGTALGTIERTGISGGAYTLGASGIKSSNGPNQVTVDGTAKVDVNTVDQITIDYPALIPGLTIGTTTAGRISINNADFQANKEKNIVFQAGNKLTLGQASVSAYPTVLGTTSGYIYTKQTSSASATKPVVITDSEVTY
ncbi:MAG: hypothetical protein RLZZ433_968 [Pseudomonadota bacterium]|jgi:hypothetical protein